ncbi:hypothetical protein BGZ49_004681 [Haplosporangium sp. Z 27]|nr:hypothetical protein BGZ49_004681 [Haplosporangium sp. Z 27]
MGLIDGTSLQSRPLYYPVRLHSLPEDNTNKENDNNPWHKQSLTMHSNQQQQDITNIQNIAGEGGHNIPTDIYIPQQGFYGHKDNSKTNKASRQLYDLDERLAVSRFLVRRSNLDVGEVVELDQRSLVNIQILTQNSNTQSKGDKTYKVIVPDERKSKNRHQVKKPSGLRRGKDKSARHRASMRTKQGQTRHRKQ